MAQARWLELSSNAKQLSISPSSEYAQFDQPDAVAGAIREVYNQSKQLLHLRRVPPRGSGTTVQFDATVQ